MVFGVPKTALEAIWVFSLKSNGNPSESALEASCPVSIQF